MRFGGRLEVVGLGPGDEALQRAGEVGDRDRARLVREFVGLAPIGRAEEERLALFGACAQVLDRGLEGVDVGLEDVEEIVAFRFLLDGKQEPGLTLDQVGEAGERDGRALQVLVRALDDVAEIGLADGGEGDAEEVDLAVLDAGEKEGERAGELGALDVDLGGLDEPKRADLLRLGDFGGLFGDGWIMA